MENQRPLILISNDDGVISKGISELIKFLRPLGEIVSYGPRCSTLWYSLRTHGNGAYSLSAST